MHVREIMSTPVATSSTNSHLNDAAQVMWECDCGSVPVVDADGRLAGIITDRDLCMAAYTQGQRLEEIPIGLAMASQVLACHIDDSVNTAEQLMREGQVRRVPVIDNDGRPVGMVSLTDLARAAVKGKGTNGRALVETVVAIVEPRS
jgi:CBS domain-containing protein